MSDNAEPKESVISAREFLRPNYPHGGLDAFGYEVRDYVSIGGSHNRTGWFTIRSEGECMSFNYTRVGSPPHDTDEMDGPPMARTLAAALVAWADACELADEEPPR